MKFDELERDVVYRVTQGNDTFHDGELVWISSSSPALHLNSVQQAACLDADEIPAGVAGLEFTPQFNWRVETKHGLGGFSRAIKETDNRIVLVSIHKKHLDNILMGRKTIEVRANFPKSVSAPFTVVLYETGNGSGSKRVRARALCQGVTTLPDKALYEQSSTLQKFMKDACLTEEELRQYMANHTALFGWELAHVQPINCSLSELRIHRAPQSWRYVEC